MLHPNATCPAVLIAEDEFLLALEIEELVRHIGCRVVGPAACVSELLDLIDATPCDVALLDVNLGHGENVYAVADWLNDRGIPFAFMTAYGKYSIDPHYADAAVIHKPVAADELASCLGILVETRPLR